MIRRVRTAGLCVALAVTACGGDADPGASGGETEQATAVTPGPDNGITPGDPGSRGARDPDPLSAALTPPTELQPLGYWQEPDGAVEDYPFPIPVETVQRAPEIPRVVLRPSAAGDAPASARNQAVALNAIGTGAQDELFGMAAGSGRTFLVVATEWSNVHPKERVEKAALEGRVDRTRGVGGFASGGSSADVEYVELDVPYRVPRLADHVYLLADGQAIALDPATAELPGGVAIDAAFDISRQGETRSVQFAFRAPSGAEHLALQHFDYQYGNIVVPLRGDPERARGSGSATGDVLASVKTELLELAAHAVRFQDGYGGEVAGDGRRFAVVTLGGRSLAGNQSQRSIVEVDPTEFLWVVSDGGYLHYGVRGTGTERGVLRFTPEVYQQQEAAFRVPASAERLTLGARINRDVVTLELSRRSPEGMPRARKTHQDGDVMEVLLFGTRRDGAHVLVDLGIQPVVEGQGLEVRARQQFLLQADGSEVQLDAARTAALVTGPPEPFVVPPGTSVRFELAFRTDGSPTTLRVRGFRGEGRLGLD